MREEYTDWSAGDLLAQDAKLLLNCFAYWSVQHNKREGTVAAHILAKDALNHAVDLLKFRDIVFLDIFYGMEWMSSVVAFKKEEEDAIQEMPIK